MPYFAWAADVPIGGIYEPLAGWQYERMPMDAVIKILHSAEVLGLICTITSGSDTLMDESPVTVFGAVGVLPSENDVEPIVDQVSAGDKIRIRYRNPTGGAFEAHGCIRF